MTQEPLHTLLHGLRRLADRSGAGGLTDAELLQRFVSRRDEAAFEVLVWRHGPMVLGVCRRLLRGRADAEDAFQATFLALVRKADSIGNGAAVGSWLYKVAYRVALAARAAVDRHAAREQELLEEPPAGDTEEVLRRDLRAVLDEEIMGLPEKYRAVFVLCYLEGKTNEEAARQLGCPRGTVLSRLARARERLRRRLTRRGLAVPAGLLAATAADGLAALPAGLAGTTIRVVAPAAAGTAAAGVSARVAALTEGVLRAMFLTRVKNVLTVVLAVALIGAGALVTGLFAGVPGEEQGPAGGAAKGRIQPGGGVAAAPGGFGKAADRARSANNLKQLGVAMHNYLDTYKHFPAPAIYAKNGKPLLSWRVTLLPYVEAGELYRQFKLDEPWDSPHNKKLLAKMPPVYAPVGAAAKPGLTYYQVFVGKGASFEPRRELKLADFPDGLSNTILAVEAARPVPWTRPEDLPYVADQALPALGGLFGGYFHALLADGSVLLCSKNADVDTLRKAITPADGEPIDFDKLRAPIVGERGEGDVELLPAENRQLKEAIQDAQREAAKMKDEIAVLSAKVRKSATDPRTAALLEEYAELRAAFHRAQRELDHLRQQKARLERLLRGLDEGRKKPTQ